MARLDINDVRFNQHNADSLCPCYDCGYIDQTAAVNPMLVSDLSTIVESHPTKVSGTLVFCGTRVPVSALFENLKDGASIDQFLEWFPGVTRAQVEALLDHEMSVLAQIA